MNKRGRAPNATVAEKARAVLLYTEQGMGIREVAAELGRGYGSVRKWLDAAAVLRQHGGYRGRDPAARR